MTEIPTNREIARVDHDDEVYRTSGERDEAVIELILNAGPVSSRFLLAQSVLRNLSVFQLN